jgi:hypothetical protein
MKCLDASVRESLRVLSPWQRQEIGRYGTELDNICSWLAVDDDRLADVTCGIVSEMAWRDLTMAEWFKFPSTSRPSALVVGGLARSLAARNSTAEGAPMNVLVPLVGVHVNILNAQELLDNPEAGQVLQMAADAFTNDVWSQVAPTVRQQILYG